jgi:disulfide bond formation protein DsbB
MSRYFVYFAWVVAWIGALISFYYGELLDIQPCDLCWYQRMALFPLLVLLGIGIYRDDRAISLYTLPFALFGASVALYQAISIRFPIVQHTLECGQECTKPIFILFGWLNFAELSAIGFIFIATLLWLKR